MVECTAHVGERLVADAEIVFAHLDRSAAGDSAAIDQKNFVFSMGLLGILEVGRAGDGAAPVS
jgi:3-hydroxyacyl-[acyl-carrier-protein] dehydratase